MAGEVNRGKLETNLSLLPWTNTKQALNHLQELLKCTSCSQLPASPHYMGQCDHFFCESCIVKLTDNICPLCKIPSLPCERKQDIIIQGLVHSVNELYDLINGAQIPVKKCSIEAPGSFLIPQVPIHSGTMNSRSASDTKLSKRNTLETSSTGSTEAQQKLNDGDFKNETAYTVNPSCKKKQLKENVYKNTKNVNQEDVNNRTPFTLKSRKVDRSLSDTVKERIPVASSSAKPQDLSVFGIALTSPVINKKNFKGETPLHSACIKGAVARVRALLEEGANPNTKDNAGWTPLHEACSHGFEGIATLLLEHGALVDVPGHCNMTPLHDAIISEALSIISLLRRWGASDTQRDMWNRTARSLVNITKQPDKVKFALATPRDPFLSAKNIQPLQTKITVLDSSLSPESKKKLEKLGKLLKVKVVNEFSDDVTHVVVGCTQNKRLCPRTIKYMMGVVSGKWILCHEWIDACLAQCHPVNPLEYEVEGPLSTPSCFAPRQGRMKASKMLPGLFSGCHIYFCGSFGDNFPTKKELEALVKAGGGIPLQREPNPESIDELEQTVPFHVEVDSPLAKCSHFCIYVEGPHQPQLKYDMVHIKSLPLSWLYDSIDLWHLVNPAK